MAAVNRTRIVRWLRVLLPLAALAILSTLFLFGKTPDTEPNIPYAEVDAQNMAREPRMTAPQYAGVTPDGAAISLSAAEATPASADGTTARGLHLSWKSPDGLTADLTAPLAGQADGTISLSGGVTMTTSTGWRLRAPQIEAATDRSRITTADGVMADAPFGQIEAGTMELLPGTDPRDHILNFTGGVRLLYQP